MPYAVTMYHCSFCKRIFKTTHWAFKHESMCPYNPLSKNCLKCEHSQVSGIFSTDCTLLSGECNKGRAMTCDSYVLDEVKWDELNK